MRKKEEKEKSRKVGKKGRSCLVETIVLLFGVGITVTILSILLSTAFPPGPRRGMSFVQELLILKTIISSVNVILLSFLIYTYLSLYKEIKSKFSLGLIAMAIALFAQSITTNPLFVMFFNFKGTGLGPFTIIPSFFTLIAAILLIYLSRK